MASNNSGLVLTNRENGFVHSMNINTTNQINPSILMAGSYNLSHSVGFKKK